MIAFKAVYHNVYLLITDSHFEHHRFAARVMSKAPPPVEGAAVGNVRISNMYNATRVFLRQLWGD